MNLLVFKLLLTPAFIGGASLAARRWGPVVGGLLVGLPLTSGPVALFLALSHGSRFAATTSVGIMAGGAASAFFCLVFSWLVFRLSWPPAWLAALGVFFAGVALFQALPGSVSRAPVPVFLAIYALLLLVLEFLPQSGGARGAAHVLWWDIPARMVIATAFVVALTSLAPALGPRLSGLLAPFPIYVSIMGIFTQRLEGPRAVAGLLHGVVTGLFSFTAFFLVLALLLVPLGIVAAFAVATIVTLSMQGAALWWLTHHPAPAKRLA